MASGLSKTRWLSCKSSCFGCENFRTARGETEESLGKFSNEIMHNWRSRRWRWSISPSPCRSLRSWTLTLNEKLKAIFILPKFGLRFKIFSLLVETEILQIFELTFSGITRSNELHFVWEWKYFDWHNTFVRLLWLKGKILFQAVWPDGTILLSILAIYNNEN